jgi:hypothetical protein
VRDAWTNTSRTVRPWYRGTSTPEPADTDTLMHIRPRADTRLRNKGAGIPVSRARRPERGTTAKKKLLFGPLLTGAIVLGLAAPAFAHDCVNLSKNPASAKAVICADTGAVTYANTGVQNRIDKFGIDPVTGEPNFVYAGPIGIDLNCDGIADVMSYQPGQGTGGVVPAAEGSNGKNVANCKGISNFETASAAGCLG